MSDRKSMSPNDLRAFWMPFTANRQFKAAPRMLVAAEGMRYTASDGRSILDGTAGLWCVNAGHKRPEDREGDPGAGGGAGLRASLPDGPPQGVLAGQRAGRSGARGPRPCDVRQFRLGGGRDRAQDRHRLSPREGRRVALPADRARARLSRREFRRDLGGRHRLQPQDVRHAADRRRPYARHPRPRAQRLQLRPARARRRAGRRPRAHREAARPVDRRRRDRRADGRLHRRAAAAWAICSACARSATATASC
jgi:hypothetical protein